MIARVDIDYRLKNARYCWHREYPYVFVATKQMTKSRSRSLVVSARSIPLLRDNALFMSKPIAVQWIWHVYISQKSSLFFPEPVGSIVIVDQSSFPFSDHLETWHILAGHAWLVQSRKGPAGQTVERKIRIAQYESFCTTGAASDAMTRSNLEAIILLLPWRRTYLFCCQFVLWFLSCPNNKVIRQHPQIRTR